MTSPEGALMARFVRRVGWARDLDDIRARHFMLSSGERAVLAWINGNRDPALLDRVDDEYRTLMLECA